MQEKTPISHLAGLGFFLYSDELRQTQYVSTNFNLGTKYRMFATRSVDMLYTVEQFTEAAKAVRRQPGIGGNAHKLLQETRVAEAHNGSPCPFCVSAMLPQVAVCETFRV